jgi:hypothetical protein
MGGVASDKTCSPRDQHILRSHPTILSWPREPPVVEVVTQCCRASRPRQFISGHQINRVAKHKRPAASLNFVAGRPRAAARAIITTIETLGFSVTTRRERCRATMDFVGP